MNLLRRLWNRRPWRPKLLMKDAVFIPPDAGLNWRPIEIGPLFSKDAIVLIKGGDRSGDSGNKEL